MLITGRLLEETEDKVSCLKLSFNLYMTRKYFIKISKKRKCFVTLPTIQFAELIKKGSVQAGDVSKVLCQDLSRHCNGER